MKLTKYEMETVIVFNEAEQTAVISTFSKRLRRVLDKCIADGDENVTKDKNGDYVCPKTYVKIRPKRRMTEEQMKRAKEHGKALSEMRKKSKS